MSDNKIEILFGYFIEPYMNYERIKVYYMKNDKEQKAVYMNYGKEKRDYRLIEDDHYARNGLRENERQEIAKALNNCEIRVYAQN